VKAIYEFHQGTQPLLISVPHDGRSIPDDIAATMTPAGLAIPDTDWHVAALYDFAGEAGLELLGKLFAEDDVRVYDPRPVQFRCRCSVRKVEEVLRMIGEAEARAVLEDRGDIEIVCEYCGQRRNFDVVDVERVFAGKPVSPGPASLQ